MLQRRTADEPIERERASPFPAGVRVLLPDEAERRRAIEGAMVRALAAASYREVILPILDYADCYAPLGLGAVSRESYRLVDRAGDLLALRNDFTPMVARAVAPSLGAIATPVRLFYRGDVVRCDSPRLGGGREYFQVGAELLGERGAAGDGEVVRLAIAAAAESGRPVVISCGDASLPSILETVPEGAALLRRLESGVLELDELRGFDPAARVVDRLDAVRVAATEAGARVVITFDPADAAGYYSGIRFRVYADGLAAPVAKGGRYDTLYAGFGADVPAVGFTLNVDALEALR